jgi:hypothetical protein
MLGMAETYAWVRSDVEHGLGMARCDEGADGITVDAWEVVADQGQRWAVRFRVVLDAGWRTREVDLTVTDDEGEHRRQLASDGAGRWTVDGVADPRLDGCIDVDIGAVPITNTFAIRRIGLDVDERADLLVAFVDVPDLSVQQLEQTYHRLAEDRWEYSDASFGRYELLVDEDGVVVDYSDFARRV